VNILRYWVKESIVLDTRHLVSLRSTARYESLFHSEGTAPVCRNLRH